MEFPPPNLSEPCNCNIRRLHNNRKDFVPKACRGGCTRANVCGQIGSKEKSISLLDFPMKTCGLCFSGVLQASKSPLRVQLSGSHRLPISLYQLVVHYDFFGTHRVRRAPPAPSAAGVGAGAQRRTEQRSLARCRARTHGRDGRGARRVGGVDAPSGGNDAQAEARPRQSINSAQFVVSANSPTIRRV